MLQEIAKALGPLNQRVVFVGGATTALYITDSGAPDPTPSDDVDFIVEITSLGQFHEFENDLRKRGFKEFVLAGRSVICRKIYGSITVDVMPSDGSILGFSNDWYPEGIKHKTLARLPDEQEIFIFTLPYFLASKLQAFNARGKSDIRQSQDMEDILAVIDGNLNAEALVKGAPETVRAYLGMEFRTLLVARNILEEAAEGFLRAAGEPLDRVHRVIRVIEELSNIWN